MSLKYIGGTASAERGKIIDADNLDNIDNLCTDCLFDIEYESLSGVIKKLELKSFSEKTINNMVNHAQFKKQFKAYLAGSGSMNDFEYVFNGKKTKNLTLIKQSFRDIFKQGNYSLWDDMEQAGSNVFRSLGITSKNQFAEKVNSLSPDLYKFISILQ